MPRELGDLLTVKELQELTAAWRDENFPDATPEDQLLMLMEETGELAHAFNKQKFGIRGFVKGEVSGAEMDSVGDILVVLAGYCSKRGISMQDAMEYAWAQVRNRDWKNNPATGEAPA
jgi:NTP pyrophosphatase (non-canonical NTP hydrolase)